MMHFIDEVCIFLKTLGQFRLSRIRRRKLFLLTIGHESNPASFSVSVYDGADVNPIPSKTDFIRQKANLIVLR